MDFDGTIELTDASTEEVWLALSDPVMIKRALPGCQIVVRVEDDVDFDALRERMEGEEDPSTLPEADPETVAERAFEQGGRYAALMAVRLGSVGPSFESVITVAEHECPEMRASGEGSASNSSFAMDSGMRLEETEDGVPVEWWAETDVFGRITQMGQRVIDPVANRMVNQFFDRIEAQLSGIGEGESSSVIDRIRDLVRPMADIRAYSRNPRYRTMCVMG